MANSEVLLLEAIKGLGSEGETVTVRAGYARNFLLPRNKAMPINQANKKQVQALTIAKEKRIEKELEASRTLADKLAQTSIAIAVKTGDSGKMFGAVTVNDILSKLAEQSIVIEKKQLGVGQPIKELGSHAIPVKLGPEISVDLQLEIVSENLISEETNPESDPAPAE